MTAPTNPPPCVCSHPMGVHLAADGKPRRHCQSGHGERGVPCTCRAYIGGVT